MRTLSPTLKCVVLIVSPVLFGLTDGFSPEPGVLKRRSTDTVTVCRWHRLSRCLLGTFGHTPGSYFILQMPGQRLSG